MESQQQFKTNKTKLPLLKIKMLSVNSKIILRLQTLYFRVTVKLIRNNTWFNQFIAIKIEGFVNILP